LFQLFEMLDDLTAKKILLACCVGKFSCLERVCNGDSLYAGFVVSLFLGCAEIPVEFIRRYGIDIAVLKTVALSGNLPVMQSLVEMNSDKWLIKLNDADVADDKISDGDIYHILINSAQAEKPDLFNFLLESAPKSLVSEIFYFAISTLNEAAINILLKCSLIETPYHLRALPSDNVYTVFFKYSSIELIKKY